MATPPLPFCTSTQHDRSRPSNSAVPTVKTIKAPHHAEAAIFMRSTHGCGILVGPSLELEAFLSQKQKRSAGSPGLKDWNIPGRLGDTESPGIYLEYEINTWMWNFLRPQSRIAGLSVTKTERICRQPMSETSRGAWDTRKALVYTWHIYGIYISWLNTIFFSECVPSLDYERYMPVLRHDCTFIFVLAVINVMQQYN